MVHIRKEIANEASYTRSFGPWMLAKMIENKYGKSRYGKNQGLGNLGSTKGNKEDMNNAHARKDF